VSGVKRVGAVEEVGEERGVPAGGCWAGVKKGVPGAVWVRVCFGNDMAGWWLAGSRFDEAVVEERVLLCGGESGRCEDVMVFIYVVFVKLLFFGVRRRQ
jgi:hypothetical protein